MRSSSQMSITVDVPSRCHLELTVHLHLDPVEECRLWPRVFYSILHEPEWNATSWTAPPPAKPSGPCTLVLDLSLPNANLGPASVLAEFRDIVTSLKLVGWKEEFQSQLQRVLLDLACCTAEEERCCPLLGALEFVNCLVYDVETFLQVIENRPEITIWWVDTSEDTRSRVDYEGPGLPGQDMTREERKLALQELLNG